MSKRQKIEQPWPLLSQDDIVQADALLEQPLWIAALEHFIDSRRPPKLFGNYREAKAMVKSTIQLWRYIMLKLLHRADFFESWSPEILLDTTGNFSRMFGFRKEKQTSFWQSVMLPLVGSDTESNVVRQNLWDFFAHAERFCAWKHRGFLSIPQLQWLSRPLGTRPLANLLPQAWSRNAQSTVWIPGLEVESLWPNALHCSYLNACQWIVENIEAGDNPAWLFWVVEAVYHCTSMSLPCLGQLENAFSRLGLTNSWPDIKAQLDLQNSYEEQLALADQWAVEENVKYLQSLKRPAATLCLGWETSRNWFNSRRHPLHLLLNMNALECDSPILEAIWCAQQGSARYEPRLTLLPKCKALHIPFDPNSKRIQSPGQQWKFRLGSEYKWET